MRNILIAVIFSFMLAVALNIGGSAAASMFVSTQQCNRAGMQSLLFERIICVSESSQGDGIKLAEPFKVDLKVGISKVDVVVGFILMLAILVVITMIIMPRSKSRKR